MAVSLDFVAAHSRLDKDILNDPDERSYVESLVTTAQVYIEQQTGKPYSDEYDLYKLCIASMVAHWYENRDAISTKTNLHDIPFSVQAQINHIALCGDYPKRGDS